jgi:hypothetical protein
LTWLAREEIAFCFHALTKEERIPEPFALVAGPQQRRGSFTTKEVSSFRFQKPPRFLFLKLET